MGRSWEGDWEARIHERVRTLGFHSLTEFANHRPNATLLALATELGKDDVNGIQVETLLRAEAEEDGTMDQFARSLLVREMRERLTGGWGNDVVEEGQRFEFLFLLASAFAAWTTALDKNHKPATDRVWDAMKAMNIPDGWLPSGFDDPILEQAFTGVSFGTHSPT